MERSVPESEFSAGNGDGVSSVRRSCLGLVMTSCMLVADVVKSFLHGKLVNSCDCALGRFGVAHSDSGRFTFAFHS